VFDYGKVFGALKCRGRAFVFELVGQTGIANAVVQSFCSIVPTELDSCRLILDDTDRIYFGTMMDDYGEVFAVFKGRGSCFRLRIGRSNWYYPYPFLQT
jgi:hypothetical protein